MATSFAFSAGWSDRLHHYGPATKYVMHKRAAIAYAYERGRHLAALYTMDVERRGGTINSEIAFKAAYKTMSKELKALVRAEQKFVRQPKRKSVLDNLKG